MSSLSSASVGGNRLASQPDDHLKPHAVEDWRFVDAEAHGPSWSEGWLRAVLRITESASPNDYPVGTVAHWLADNYLPGDPLPDLGSEPALADISVHREASSGLPHLVGFLKKGSRSTEVRDRRIVPVVWAELEPGMIDCREATSLEGQRMLARICVEYQAVISISEDAGMSSLRILAILQQLTQTSLGDGEQ